MEISEDFSGSSNDQMILKGKRTKRLRPSSSSASSSGGAGYAAAAVEFDYNSLLPSSSPTSSSGISTTTEEDEDMANCLILLARGGSSEDQIRPEEIKFSSRRFTEMATTTTGKVGVYVYECKTCTRTFPSFQALGGHRASHKKPKHAAETDQKKSPADYRGGEDAPPPSARFSGGNCGVESKHKIHECSICGSEFASGQALGGHMRRHRSATNNNGVGDQKSGNMLDLDLNLPAPPEDDLRETKFQQFSPDQRRSLVFSAAALVDCHYCES